MAEIFVGIIIGVFVCYGYHLISEKKKAKSAASGGGSKGGTKLK